MLMNIPYEILQNILWKLITFSKKKKYPPKNTKTSLNMSKIRKYSYSDFGWLKTGSRQKYYAKRTLNGFSKKLLNYPSHDLIKLKLLRLTNTYFPRINEGKPPICDTFTRVLNKIIRYQKNCEDDESTQLDHHYFSDFGYNFGKPINSIIIEIYGWFFNLEFWESKMIFQQLGALDNIEYITGYYLDLYLRKIWRDTELNETFEEVLYNHMKHFFNLYVYYCKNDFKFFPINCYPAIDILINKKTYDFIKLKNERSGFIDQDIFEDQFQKRKYKSEYSDKYYYCKFKLGLEEILEIIRQYQLYDLQNIKDFIKKKKVKKFECKNNEDFDQYNQNFKGLCNIY